MARQGTATLPVTIIRYLSGIGLALTLAGALGSCGEENGSPEPAPYLEITGGGFVFNYRVADAYYGFVARPLRSLPEGSLLEARFEDPADGPPHITQRPAGTDVLRYSFRSPPLRGIEADKPYQVELRLLAADAETVLQTATKSYKSLIDQDVNPEEPLTVGPGYHKNPASRQDSD